jgi:hypothetical protein
MTRIWTVLLLAVCAVGPGRTLAAPGDSYRCDPDHIRAALESTGRVPSLRGCNPDAVRDALGSADYGLIVENRHSSNSISAGRIVSQRIESSRVYVTLSTGPDHEPDTQQVPEVVGQIFGRILSNLPTHKQGTAAPLNPIPEPYPAPTPLEPPVPPAHAAQPAPEPLSSPNPTEPFNPPTDQPIVEPPAANPPPPINSVQAPAHHPQPNPTPSQQAKPASRPVQLAQGPEQQLPPGPRRGVTPPTLQAEPAPQAPFAPAPEQMLPPPQPPPHPATRFSLQGGANVREGDELNFVVRRQNSDGNSHRLKFNYSDPRLLASPPSSFDFRSDLPDEVTLRLPTAARASSHRDHDLVIILASAGGAHVDRPNFVTVVILDRPPWWRELLGWLTSWPVWAVALGAAGAAGTGVGLKFLAPGATCSIERGSVGLGRAPLRSRWPALRVDTVIGRASFSIPHPLPTGERTDAEPSPA